MYWFFFYFKIIIATIFLGGGMIAILLNWDYISLPPKEFIKHPRFKWVVGFLVAMIIGTIIMVDMLDVKN